MNNNIVGSLRGEGHEVHKAQIEYGHNFHLNNNNMIMIIIIIIIIIIVIIIIIIIIIIMKYEYHSYFCFQPIMITFIIT